MNMAVRGVRVAFGWERGFVHFDMLARSQRTFQDSSHFGMVQCLHWHFVEREGCRWQGFVRSRKEWKSHRGRKQCWQ